MLLRSPSGVIQVEKSGYDKGIERASEIAASYDLETPKSDEICRALAREISNEVD